MTEQQQNSIKALAIWLDNACDKEGCPLKAGVAERVARRIADAAPAILEALEETARGKVT